MNEEKGMRVYSGYCPDPECKKRLFFPSYLSSSIECTNCGQHHEKSSLLDVTPVSDAGVAIRSLYQNILLSTVQVNKKGSESIKVLGLSNYQCKLVSPLLTRYGYDRTTQTVRLLKDMGQGETFDCCHLGDRAFLIEEENLHVSGYGRDRSGAEVYLKHTLDEVESINSNKNRLVPIHADGDGHCLVHAISRALVGRELFWHPLMTGLKLNLMESVDRYKFLMKDFIDEDEWNDIIREADPNFEPDNGEPLGLRNIHIFALANVLHRPIILIDGIAGMHSKGDYSAVFLPVLIPPDKCKGKDDHLNKPLVIAWSSSGRNHFVPLVGLRGRPAPRLPSTLLPKPWAVPYEQLKVYIEFDSNGHCIVGGEKSLQDRYLQKLVLIMEKKFEELYRVSPVIVADVYQHIFKPSGVVGVTPRQVTESTQVAIDEERLYRCLTCSVVTEKQRKFPISWLASGGLLYSIAVSTHGELKDGFQYKFPQHKNCTCRYDKKKNRLIPLEDPSALLCKFCQGPLRVLRRNGSLVYNNGDRTTTEAKKSNCNCGYKHYWDGREYDNLPERIPVILEWNNQIKTDIVYWFQFESDPSLNSNAFEIAQGLVQKHFPGEFGSERLVQRVVDQIFKQTMKDEPKKKGKTEMPAEASGGIPTKIILTGEKSKSTHKEELTHSKAEEVVKKKIEHAAAFQQKRSSASPSKKYPVSGSLPKLPHSEGKQSTSSPPKEQQSLSYPADSSVSSSPASSSPSLPPAKRIRISASNGRSATLPLPAGMTYKDLRDAISSNFNIPPELQKIKYGFPPKELKPHDEGGETEVVPLQHGDRVVVEEIVVKPLVEEKMETEEASGSIISPADTAISALLHFKDVQTGQERDTAEEKVEKKALETAGYTYDCL